MKCLLMVFILFLLSIPLQAQEKKPSADNSIENIAQHVAGESGSSFQKTQRLVVWINTNFNWTYTDYQKRTVQEIIERRGGNCAELANVLFALLQATRIQARWVVEINIHPKKDRRQQDAEGLMKKWGNKATVFGFMHNDHRWLEVFDDATQSWFPADPSAGVVGTSEWVVARLGFTNRPTSPVPEIAAIVKDMIAPFVVIAMESKDGKQKEDRSTFYLLDAFNQTYGNKLQHLPSWTKWDSQIKKLSPIAAAAFKGEMNLHQSANLIAELEKIYEQLSKEAIERNIQPSSGQIR